MEQKKTNRIAVALVCTECGDRNYTTTKNRQSHHEALTYTKYCPRLRRHTLHREAKI